MKNYLADRIFSLKRVLAYVLRKLGLKPSLSLADLAITSDFESQDPSQKFTRQWFTALYQDLNDGVPCYRADDPPNYDGGVLSKCHCCRPNIKLNLLPNEEKMFADAINDWDFRLADNPEVPNRKSIYCNKQGLCGGHKPFVCRTHPVYFANGCVLVEERLCRLPAFKIFQFHHEQIERIRKIVVKYGLDKVTLGYCRRIYLENGQEIIEDFHH